MLMGIGLHSVTTEEVYWCQKLTGFLTFRGMRSVA